MIVELVTEFESSKKIKINRTTSPKLYPLRYKNEEIRNHFIDSNGDIYSLRHNSTDGYYYYKKKPYAVNGYPQILVSLKKGDKKLKHIVCHIAACEMFVKKPLPTGVTKKEWNAAAESIKKCFEHYWEVNHIDNNTYNYHPSNLEWVSRRENIDKHHEKLRLSKLKATSNKGKK